MYDEENLTEICRTTTIDLDYANLHTLDKRVSFIKDWFYTHDNRLAWRTQLIRLLNNIKGDENETGTLPPL